MNGSLSGMITRVTVEPGGPLPPGPAPKARLLAVHVEVDGRELTLHLPSDASAFNQWAVDAAERMERPAHFTLSEDTIVDVALPDVGRVTLFDRTEAGAVNIGLDSTPRLFTLPESAARDALASRLERARTSHEIVMLLADDLGVVRSVDSAPLRAQRRAPRLDEVGTEPFKDVPVSTISAESAADAFRTIMKSDCRVGPQPNECIPFDYPNEGCETRAQQICTHLAVRKIVAGKVWLLRPTKRIPTRNALGRCDISWSWHVAPYVRVSGPDSSDAVVFDPALFPDGPVPLSDFVSMLIGKSRAKFSRAKFYQMGEDGRGSTEFPNQSRDDLEVLREKARNRRPQPPYEC